MGFINEKTEEGKWRTIDREKNTVLSKVSGPDKEGIWNCELLISGQVVNFLAVVRDKVHGNPKLGETRQYDMDWQIYSVFMLHTGRKA